MIVYVEERLDHHAEVNAAARKDLRDDELAKARQASLAQRELGKASVKPKEKVVQKIVKAPRKSPQPGNIVCDKREIIGNETRHHNYNDLSNYKLHNNITYYMPPPSIIAPSIYYPAYYLHHMNHSYFAANNIPTNYSLAADRGSSFSVSRKMNADSGSSGTYVAIRDSHFLTDVRATTENSRIGVTVANGETIFSSHIGVLHCRAGTCCRPTFSRI